MNNSTNEHNMNDFEQARALLLSYLEEDGDDTRMTSALLAVWNTCSTDSFNRLLIFAEAVGDPRFTEFGAADALSILRGMELSDNATADKERLLDAMRVEDAAAYRQAEQEAAEQGDPYRRAAIRLLTKFREPNIHQVMYELTKL